MTLREAIKAKLYPYALPDASIELLMENQGLDMTDDYDRDEHELACAYVEVEALTMLITLTREQDGGSTQQYDVAAMERRMRRICAKYGIKDEAYTPSVEDATDTW